MDPYDLLKNTKLPEKNVFELTIEVETRFLPLGVSAGEVRSWGVKNLPESIPDFATWDGKTFTWAVLHIEADAFKEKQ